MEITGYLGETNFGEWLGREETETVSGYDFSKKFGWQKLEGNVAFFNLRRKKLNT